MSVGAGEEVLPVDSSSSAPSDVICELLALLTCLFKSRYDSLFPVSSHSCVFLPRRDSTTVQTRPFFLYDVLNMQRGLMQLNLMMCPDQHVP